GTPVVHYPIWESRAFTVMSDAPYWTTRIEIWNNKHTWGIGAEWIHQKIFLVNTDNHIQHLDISHGYNLVLANFAYKAYAGKVMEIITRVGIGPVVAHPELRIDGIYNGTADQAGFMLAGIGGQFSLQFRLPIADYLSGLLEIKYTIAYAIIPFSGINRENNTPYTGSLHVPHHAIHLNWGFGFDFYHAFHYKKDYRETARRAPFLSIRSIQERSQAKKTKTLNIEVTQTREEQ
ncbi:MAG: hypothetical protein ACRC9L_00815, partial [Brevinema sp.]